AGDQFDARSGMGVDVGFAAEVLDQVDDDLHAAGVGEVELFGPDAEGDFGEACVVQFGQLVAVQFQCGVADLDAVGGDRERHQVHGGGSDEAGDERVGGAVVELVGCGELLQLAEPQYGDPVAHRHGLDLVV